MDSQNGQADHTRRSYIAIDLKSFYASVETRELGLDPLTTNLVVADVSRTEKTICLAVSPSLKAYGISGRARLFEVVRRVEEINRRRLARAKTFTGESCDSRELDADPSLKLSYIAAAPRMSLYMEYSARIYRIYLRYIAPEDIHVYSIDEVLIDATRYLDTYRLTPHELARKMMREVLRETGITATAGIGTNLYLAKIAMDIMAKHAQPDEDGVRIAELDEMSYRRQLWCHRPLTDFWRVGKGYARKLEAAGMFTMGDVARCSIRDEDILYKMFGVNAELLIDHAWGWEPCTMDLVKAYEPDDRSFSSGQVLMEPYSFEKARVVVHEMADAAALDLVKKRMCTDQVVLTINYERLDAQPENVRGGDRRPAEIRDKNRDSGLHDARPENARGGDRRPAEIRDKNRDSGLHDARPENARGGDRRPAEIRDKNRDSGLYDARPGNVRGGDRRPAEIPDSEAVTLDYYGRKVPKHAHGTENLAGPTSSGKQIVEAALRIYDRTVNPD
ncbi:MAG: DNA methylase [Eubacteriales bacterium]|nr:DNA methylase [Eubacteriales bacterium]